MKSARRAGGQSLIEFTLVLLLLVVVLFAIIQYGFIFAAYITVRNASAVGARSAAILNRNFADAQTDAKNALGPLLNPTLSTANAGTATITNPNDAKSMTVTYALPLVIPFVVPGGGSNRLLTATTVMK